MESNLPAFQFYPADWLTSSKVRLLSLEEKGFYIELLCHLHKGAHRGKLCDENGTPYTTEEVSLLMGYPLSLVENCLTKFLTKKILEVEAETKELQEADEKRRYFVREVGKECYDKMSPTLLKLYEEVAHVFVLPIKRKKND